MPSSESAAQFARDREPGVVPNPTRMPLPPRPEESGGRIVLELSDDPRNATARVFPAERHIRLAVVAHIPARIVSRILLSSRPYAPPGWMRSGNRPFHTERKTSGPSLMSAPPAAGSGLARLHRAASCQRDRWRVNLDPSHALVVERAVPDKAVDDRGGPAVPQDSAGAGDWPHVAALSVLSAGSAHCSNVVLGHRIGICRRPSRSGTLLGGE